MADDEFSQQAAAIAIASAENDLIEASRAYQDASRLYGDPETGAAALSNYVLAKQKYDALMNAGNNCLLLRSTRSD